MATTSTKNEKANGCAPLAISNSQQQLTSVAIIQHSDVARNPQAFVTAKRTPRIHGRANRLWSLVVERCPLCGGKHVHGGGVDDEPSLGDRVSHCLDGTGGYLLVLATEGGAA